MQFNSKAKEVIFWLMAGGAFLLMVYNTMLYRNTGVRTGAPVIEIENGTSLVGFSLKESDGKEFVIPSAGRYLVSFLTTGCAPCQSQVESLNKTAGMGRYDKVLAIFFEPRTKVEQFKSVFSPEFTCLIDHKGALNDKLKLSAYPQTVELNDGLVIRSWTGLQEGFDD